MKKYKYQIAGLIAAVLLTACPRQVDSPQGFRLPPGDAKAGQEAFVSIGCITCHTVKGQDLPAPTEVRKINVELGGEVHRVKTYAQLVTSIIYPSHAIRSKRDTVYEDAQGNSLMPDLTSDMTVRQMVDITQYLQQHYKVVVPQYPTDNSFYP